MIRDDLKNMFRGWFVGNFEPSIYKTDQFEVGVLYLTPNAPITSGTGLFRHKLTKWTTEPYFDNGEVNQNLKDLLYMDAWDMTKWEMHTMVGNMFNRLVLYKANQWHQSLDYFGNDIVDGRLFMTFFFNTEI